MTIYSKKVELIQKTARQDHKNLLRHQSFYPILEEVVKCSEGVFFINQYPDEVIATIYLKETEDKTLPYLMQEIVLSYDFIEESSEPKSNPKSGEIHFFFQMRNPSFGEGPRPKFKLVINYTSQCKFVKVSTHLEDDYEYVCNGGA